jgi:hypothetical protein
VPAGARGDPRFAGAYRSLIVRRSCLAGAPAHPLSLIRPVCLTRLPGSSYV